MSDGMENVLFGDGELGVVLVPHDSPEVDSHEDPFESLPYGPQVNGVVREFLEKYPDGRELHISQITRAALGKLSTSPNPEHLVSLFQRSGVSRWAHA